MIDYKHTYPLTAEAAAALGVKPGIPVVPTSSDGGLNQVGVGASVEGVMTFSVGTSGAIRLTTAQPVLPDQPSTWCYMSPKAWLSRAATNGCWNASTGIRITPLVRMFPMERSRRASPTGRRTRYSCRFCSVSAAPAGMMRERAVFWRSCRNTRPMISIWQYRRAFFSTCTTATRC